MISRRTKDALAAAKARGVTLRVEAASRPVTFYPLDGGLKTLKWWPPNLNI